MTRSLRRRLARRGLTRWQVPMIHPRTDRLREAAIGGHRCQPVAVLPDGQVIRLMWAHPAT